MSANMMFFTKTSLIMACLISGSAVAEPIQPQQNQQPQASCPEYLNFTAKKLHSGETINLCELTQGKPVLIVNTASHCGFTKQFSGLEAINKDYQQQGLVVIGFPSDDFNQEANDQAETAEVCYRNYGVSFTMLAPMPVRGQDANPVFQYLAEQTTAPKWNFYKYLVSGNGETVLQFNSFTKPDSADFKQAVESIL